MDPRPLFVPKCAQDHWRISSHADHRVQTNGSGITDIQHKNLQSEKDSPTSNSGLCNGSGINQRSYNSLEDVLIGAFFDNCPAAGLGASRSGRG